MIGIRVFRSRQGDVKRTAKSFSFLRGQENSLEEERRAMVAEIRAGSEGADVEAFLGKLVSERLNVIVSGGTSTGKTELGRKLLEMVAADERIVTIEDSLEPARPAQYRQSHRGLMRSSPARPTSSCRPGLRLRPDRIILGELPGPGRDVSRRHQHRAFRVRSPRCTPIRPAQSDGPVGASRDGPRHQTPVSARSSDTFRLRST